MSDICNANAFKPVNFANLRELCHIPLSYNMSLDWDRQVDLESTDDYEDLLTLFLISPEDAVRDWVFLTQGAFLDTEEAVMTYITQCFDCHAPLFAPSYVKLTMQSERFAALRQYVELGIQTPGVEVFCQDGKIFICSPISTVSVEVTGVHGLISLSELESLACASVRAFMRECCGMEDAMDEDAMVFNGWKIDALPEGFNYQDCGLSFVSDGDGRIWVQPDEEDVL